MLNKEDFLKWVSAKSENQKLAILIHPEEMTEEIKNLIDIKIEPGTMGIEYSLGEYKYDSDVIVIITEMVNEDDNHRAHIMPKIDKPFRIKFVTEVEI